jgi:neopullulanase
MHMRKLILFSLILSLGTALPAQRGKENKAASKSEAMSYRIDPPFWWVGMQNNELELLLFQPGGAKWEASLSYPGVDIVDQGPADNPKYCYIRLSIAASAQPGTLNFVFGTGKEQFKLPYVLKARDNRPGAQSGITTADFIYLAMPDRFANGDPGNDIVKGMEETGLNRDSMFWRHGGDLLGVQNHLDHIVDLGATALWLNPVLENNEPKASYHGYAITDHYKVDPRFGTNEGFKELVAVGHAKGLKAVLDVVYNHIGDQHHLYKELPWQAWVHRFPEGYVRTSYRAPVLMDPYASDRDKKIMTDGWFDHHMPDLDQTDAHLATYLIQNSVWWVEYADLDAFRIDTYAYPDQAFMNDLCKALFKEYPRFSIFGETWVDGAPVQVFFHGNNINVQRQSELPGVTDFQLYYGIMEALQREQGWTEGVARLYHTLGTDYLHADPFKNVIFLDNHDISRFYSMVGEDFRKFKMGIAWLMTTRGIPQLYYGTEILMKNYANPDGKVRDDFPGGWTTDKSNKFTEAGRSAKEQEAYAYIRMLAQWRKTSRAVHAGRTTQFVPENGVYTYARRGKGQAVLVIMNCSEKGNKVDMARFAECYGDATLGVDVMTQQRIDLKGTQEMTPWSVWVLELQP